MPYIKNCNPTTTKESQSPSRLQELQTEKRKARELKKLSDCWGQQPTLGRTRNRTRNSLKGNKVKNSTKRQLTDVSQKRKCENAHDIQHNFMKCLKQFSKVTKKVNKSLADMNKSDEKNIISCKESNEAKQVEVKAERQLIDDNKNEKSNIISNEEDYTHLTTKQINSFIQVHRKKLRSEITKDELWEGFPTDIKIPRLKNNKSETVAKHIRSKIAPFSNVNILEVENCGHKNTKELKKNSKFSCNDQPLMQYVEEKEAFMTKEILTSDTNHNNQSEISELYQKFYRNGNNKKTRFNKNIFENIEKLQNVFSSSKAHAITINKTALLQIEIPKTCNFKNILQNENNKIGDLELKEKTCRESMFYTKNDNSQYDIQQKGINVEVNLTNKTQELISAVNDETKGIAIMDTSKKNETKLSRKFLQSEIKISESTSSFPGNDTDLTNEAKEVFDTSKMDNYNTPKNCPSNSTDLFNEINVSPENVMDKKDMLKKDLLPFSTMTKENSSSFMKTRSFHVDESTMTTKNHTPLNKKSKQIIFQSESPVITRLQGDSAHIDCLHRCRESYKSLPEMSTKKRKSLTQELQLIEDSYLGKSACLLWVSEERRHYQQEHPEATCVQLNEYMRMAWGQLPSKQKLVYFIRAKAVQEGKSNIKKKITHRENTLNDKTVTLDVFREKNGIEQDVILAEKMAYIEKELPHHQYTDFVKDFQNLYKNSLLKDMEGKYKTTTENRKKDFNDVRCELFKIVSNTEHMIADLKKEISVYRKKNLLQDFHAAINDCIDCLSNDDKPCQCSHIESPQMSDLIKLLSETEVSINSKPKSDYQDLSSSPKYRKILDELKSGCMTGSLKFHIGGEVVNVPNAVNYENYRTLLVSALSEDLAGLNWLQVEQCLFDI